MELLRQVVSILLVNLMNMNRLFVFIFVLLVCGCQSNEEPAKAPSESLRNCGLSALFSPDGYFVNLLGGIAIEDYTSKSFHFVDEFNGFQIAYNKIEGKNELLKTDDGGVTWGNAKLPSNGIGVSLPSSLSMKNILFKDDEVASLFTTTSVMFKTKNGGLTWSHSGTKKGLQHYAYASDRLYASNSEDMILVSVNDGETWSVLSDHPNFKFWRTDFSFKIIGDMIYALGDEDKLVIINLEGEFVKEISPNIGAVSGIYSIDESTFVVSSYDKMFITKDGGESFSVYYEGVAEIISLLSEDEAIMVIKTSGSTGDGIYSCDEIAYTTDGGMSWIQSGTCIINLMSLLKGSQTISNNRSVCLFRNCIFEIKRN